MLKCPICQNDFEKSILSHVRQTHKLSVGEFKKQFPDDPLREAWMKGKVKSDPRVAKIAKASGDSKRGKKGSNSQLPSGMWSREHDCCVQCGTSKIPHSSNGLCKQCRTKQSFEEIEENIQWTPDEEKILLEKYSELVPVKQINQSIPGKTYLSVRDKLKELVITKRRRSDVFRRHLPNDLTPEEESVIFGSLLGDGCICKQKDNNFCFRESHGPKQREYAFWKSQKMLRWHPKTYLSDQSGHHVSVKMAASLTDEEISQRVYKFDLPYHSLWKEIYDKIYISSKKRVISQWWLDKITPLSVAIWIADDGSRHGTGLTLCTHNFDEQDHKMMSQFFKDKFGVDARIDNSDDSEYFWLWFGAAEYRTLLEQIPWQQLPPVMYYKFDMEK